MSFYALLLLVALTVSTQSRIILPVLDSVDANVSEVLRDVDALKKSVGEYVEICRAHQFTSQEYDVLIQSHFELLNVSETCNTLYNQTKRSLVECEVEIHGLNTTSTNCSSAVFSITEERDRVNQTLVRLESEFSELQSNLSETERQFNESVQLMTDLDDKLVICLNGIQNITSDLDDALEENLALGASNHTCSQDLEECKITLDESSPLQCGKTVHPRNYTLLLYRNVGYPYNFRVGVGCGPVSVHVEPWVTSFADNKYYRYEGPGYVEYSDIPTIPPPTPGCAPSYIHTGIRVFNEQVSLTSTTTNIVEYESVLQDFMENRLSIYIEADGMGAACVTFF